LTGAILLSGSPQYYPRCQVKDLQVKSAFRTSFDSDHKAMSRPRDMKLKILENCRNPRETNLQI